jgi:hypothetical protein
MSSSRADLAEVRLSALRAGHAAEQKTLESEIQSRLALAEKLRLITWTLTPRQRDGGINGVLLGGNQMASGTQRRTPDNAGRG